MKPNELDATEQRSIEWLTDSTITTPRNVIGLLREGSGINPHRTTHSTDEVEILKLQRNKFYHCKIPPE